MTVLYLHGFASSPQSTKAGWLADHLRPYGLELQCPDLNQPDFATLTLTRMIDQVDQATARAGAPVVLIGSSLGGTVAVLAAARFPARIDRLVLLAPAVMFAKPGHHLLPPARIEEWARHGTLPFYHHGAHAERPLQYSFYVDSLQYNAFDAAFPQPTLIFQGLHDASVDHRMVERFARARPNVALSLLDDDHQLVTSLPTIWCTARAFLGLDA